ncbi:MAG TPA: M20/M25/M40 family metallo-hydrolase, partial [Patescibacteria group bacterium]
MKDEIISLAKKLISIPSTVDNISALQKVLEIAEENIDAPFLQKFSQNDNPSLFAANRKDFSEKFRLVLNAHIDVVPGREDQYTPVIKDAKLFGRGAADMKSAAAVIILVFNQLVNKVNFPLGLQITTDEETGGHNGTKFQLEKGLKTDFAISGELTNLSINLKAKGIIQLSILSSGKTAHSAYPWNGENALWKLVDILHSLKEKFPVPQKEAWETSINLAKIETSNLTNNKIPNDALAKLDIRFTPEQSSAVRDELEKIKNMGFEIIIGEDE